MHLAISSRHAKKLAFIVKGNSSYEAALFQGNFLRMRHLKPIIIKLDLITVPLKAHDHVGRAAMQCSLNHARMIGFINHFSGQAKARKSLGSELRYFVSHRISILLPTTNPCSLTASNCIRTDGLHDVLHELSPLHHAISININFLKQLVATVERLVLLVIVVALYDSI